jgi:exodeoxyribonuclease V alpha subunit
VVDIVQNRIPRKFGLDPLGDVQVLTPMRKGTVGVDNLNRLLQAALNPPRPGKPEQKIGGHIFRVGDRVMQIRNDYVKQVVNGDIGMVVEVDDEAAWGEADDLRHAFAASIHKAQGSEFPAVVVPVLKQHRRMLKRNLLYTAVTRAQKLCVLVGTRQAIRMAVENVSAVKRWSGLASRLGNQIRGSSATLGSPT